MKRMIIVLLMCLAPVIAKAELVSSVNTMVYSTMTVTNTQEYYLLSVPLVSVGGANKDLTSYLGVSMPETTEVWLWTSDGYDIWRLNGGAWCDPVNTPGSPELVPGTGFWLVNTTLSNFTITLSGEANEAATVAMELSAGYTLCGPAYSATMSLYNDFDWSGTPTEAEIKFWTGSGYDTWMYYEGDWYAPDYDTSDINIPMWEGFWFGNPGTAFTVTQTKPY